MLKQGSTSSSEQEKHFKKQRSGEASDHNSNIINVPIEKRGRGRAR